MESLEIYFDDLDEETQERVLKFYDLVNAEDENFDINPLFILGNLENGE